MYNNHKNYITMAFTLLIFTLFIFGHQFVCAEEMEETKKPEEITMSKGDNDSRPTGSPSCKSSNPICVSASSEKLYKGDYLCGFAAIGDNCTATITYGSNVLNITVGDPSKNESEIKVEEFNITLEVEKYFFDTSNTEVCVSDNPSCVSTYPSTASSSIGTYSCKFQAIAPNCSANVTIGMGNGTKIYHVTTEDKNYWWNEVGDDESNNSSNNNGSLTCNYVLGEDYDDPQYIAYYVVRLLTFVKFSGPILVIIMTIIDLIKVLANGKNDELTKLGVKTLKRLMYAIMLFIIPTLLDWVFKLVGIYGVCGIS